MAIAACGGDTGDQVGRQGDEAFASGDRIDETGDEKNDDDDDIPIKFHNRILFYNQ